MNSPGASEDASAYFLNGEHRVSACWHKLTVFVLLTSAISAQSAGAQASADAPVSAVIDITHADLAAAPVAANWPSYNGDYTGRRFTSLNQISPSNVDQLRGQWVFHAAKVLHLDTVSSSGWRRPVPHHCGRRWRRQVLGLMPITPQMRVGRS